MQAVAQDRTGCSLCPTFHQQQQKVKSSKPTRIWLSLQVGLILINVIVGHAVERIRRLEEVFTGDGSRVLVSTLYHALGDCDDSISRTSTVAFLHLTSTTHSFICTAHLGPVFPCIFDGRSN